MQQANFREKYNYFKATPVMQQFLDIKFDNIECLLLFRMGDFYELFYEDAIIASRALGIALTKRGKTGEDEIAMCGVPHHSLENYLNKLLEEGFKVAICDQMETPEQAKKRGGYKAVVNRSVVRIITPGTIIEESLLEVGKPNYLTSIVIGKQISSIAAIDLSTSEFSVISLPEPSIFNEIARLAPKEILLSDKHRITELATLIGSQLNLRISWQVDSFYDIRKSEKNILDFYKIHDLKSIGQLNNTQISALGSIIEYISLTQKENLPKLLKPKILNYQKFMSIDASTRRNLEIEKSQSGGINGSLFACINNTVSKGGSRLLYQYLSTPLIDINAINKRLNITTYFYNNISLVESIKKLLKKTGDLERCITRLNMSRSTPKDLLSIKHTIEIAEQIYAEFIAKQGIDLPDYIDKIIKPLLGQNKLYELISKSIREDATNSINDGKIIKPSYHPKVAELYNLIENSQSTIDNLRNQYRTETGIDTLKINHNNVLGLFIDITARHADKILNSKFIHRQTTANSIRYTTSELQELESKMVNAKMLVISLEQEIYHKICHELMQNQNILLSLANALNILDVYSAFAHLANENDYCCPKLSDDIQFQISEGRHPVVESALAKSNKDFVHNDCDLSSDERIWLITGPNMAGKSTYLRQNAIISILAHIGSYVPAKSANIGVIDKIFSRIGSGDDLNKGQSTFMLEMLETSAILTQSSHKSLIILDEVGRGTSTYDGVAIAWSVLEHIHDKIRGRCLFATHYHELTAMEEILPAFANYTIDIKDNEGVILFLHKIIKGMADRSYGVHVAELAGLPKSVIKKASSLLKKFEKDSIRSNKKIMQTESYNLNLFDTKIPNKEEQTQEQMQGGVEVYTDTDTDINIIDNKTNTKCDKVYSELIKIDPDKLTPKEALDLLYKLKEIS